MKALSKFYWYVILLFLFCLPQISKATHLAGADLTYRCLGGLNYEIEVVWYRDCSGIAAPVTETVNLISASLNVNRNITVNRIPGTGQEVTVPCNSAATTCNGGTVPGIQKWVYRANVTLNGLANDWVFSIRRNARNTVITNVNLTTNSQGASYNPGQTGPFTYVEARLNNIAAPCNSSPNFSNDPILFLCANQLFTFNQGSQDADGDSIAFELTAPLDGPNATLVYNPPFTFLNPLTANPPLNINAQSGDITVRPTQVQVSVFAVKVSEYRNGVLIGSVMRDLQVFVTSCNNNIPAVSGINGTTNFSADICAGQPFCFTINSIDADAAQVVTLNWNQGIPGASFTVSQGSRPTAEFCWTPPFSAVSLNPSTFTVTVRDNACPSNGVQVFSYSLKVSGLAVSLINDTSFCGNGITLTPIINGGLGGPFSYLWSNGATTASLFADSTNNYSVTVTENGCSGTDNVNITLLSFPDPQTIIPIDSLNVCNNENFAISAVPGFASYLWSNGATSASISPTTSGIYSVTVTTQDGCTGSDQAVLIVRQAPAIDLGPNRTICGSNLVLGPRRPLPGETYLWSTGAITPFITITQSGTYSVTVSGANGCQTSDVVTLIFGTTGNFEIFAAEDTTICDGSSVVLSVSPNNFSSFQWSTGETSSAITVDSTATISINAIDIFGCPNIDDIKVFIGNSPMLNLPEDTSFCSGTGLILDAGANFDAYEWSTGETTNSISVGNSGIFTVTVTGEFACSTVSSVNVTESPKPIVDLGPDIQICSNGSVTLTPTQSFSSYLWSTGETTTSIEVDSSGIFYVLVTDSNGCLGDDVISVSLFPEPIVDLGSDIQICSNGTVNLSLATSFVSYIWSTGETTSSIDVNQSGIFSVIVTDSNGCEGNDEVEVSLFSVPDAGLPDVAVICFADSLELIANAGFTSYEWNTGETTSSISITQGGLYTITVIDQNGCSGTDAVEVSENPEITLVFQTSGDCVDNAGEILLTVNGGAAPFIFEWTAPGNLSFNTQNLSNVVPGNYNVVVTDDAGCSAEGNVSLSLNPILVDAGPDSVVICEGGEAQLQASGATFYVWSPADGLDNPRIENPIASPTATTTYVVTGSVPGNNIIFNGDFEQGNVGFSNNYIFTTTNLVPERTYSVVSNPNPLHPAFVGSDHTSGSGNFLAVNGSVTPNLFVWCQRVNVQPNTDYSFSAWISTLVASSPAELEFSINNQILGVPIIAPANTFQWDQFFATWNSGNNVIADICIVNRNTVASGNDFGLDDISFAPICSSTDTIVVVVNPTPEPNLGVDDTLCVGTRKVLSPGSEFVSYLWSNQSVGATLTVDTSGIYSVTVTDANGCTASDTISISSKNCCFPAEFGNLFTLIDNTNNVISQNTVWSGKYFITADVVVQNGATLDITNVDVVFDENIGITFLDSSRIRANNSVFRTCDYNVSWKGFDFLDNSSGLFNENVIKNAVVALDLKTRKSLQIRNNEFYNFSVGINYDNAGNGNFGGAATANTFVSNEERPDFFDANGNLINDVFSIKTFNTIFSGLISQNSFVNSIQAQGNGVRMYGVYINSSAVSVTDNQFSNLYRAVDITGNNGAVTLENNKIENTIRSHDDVFAIRITDALAAPILVEGNEISFALLANNITNQAGIYVDNVSNLIIHQNSIKGFDTGLRLGGNSVLVQITDNQFNDLARYAIYVENSEEIDITNNQIKKAGESGIAVVDVIRNLTIHNNVLDIGNFNSSYGIRLQLNASAWNAPSIRITSNCINNSSHAMAFEAIALGADLPLIRNNYMFNYESIGIWSINFSGEIGTCANYPVEAGRNSFISNFLSPFGSAVDVRSDNATILMSGNGPNLVISFPTVLVNTSCNTTSTASCGNQIGNNELGGRLGSPLTQLQLFQNLLEAHYPISLQGNEYKLNSDFLTQLLQIENDAKRLKTILALLAILNDNESSSEMDFFFQQIVSSQMLQNNNAKWFQYEYFINKQNFNSAFNNLNAIQATYSSELDRKQIATIQLTLLMSNRKLNELTSAEIQILKQIDDFEGEYAAVARDIIQAAEGMHDYQFVVHGLALPSDNGAQSNGTAMDDNFVRVYPNPAQDEVTIAYLTNHEATKVNIRITDVLGKILWEAQPEFNNGQIKVDISQYAHGTYYIFMFSEKEVIKNTKLVKF